MPKRTSAANGRSPELRVTLVTLDGHLAGAAHRAFAKLRRSMPSLRCSLHCAGEWSSNPESLSRCLDDIATGHIVIVCMLFMEEHFRAVQAALEARRDSCDAMLCFMSAGEIMKLTRIGGFTMDGQQSGPMALLKKLRGSKSKEAGSNAAKQVAMLKRLPRILRFIPGTAQDLRAYFLTMQYWLAGSEDNLRNLIALLVSRYASGPRQVLRSRIKVQPPVEYPEIGVYHPSFKGGVSESPARLPKRKSQGSVGVLLMRSYVLAGNTKHYDAVIEALERRNLRAVPVFATGLDARPAVEQFFQGPQAEPIDALISLTGFSLVGGPAYNDAQAATAMLAELDVPCFSAHATEFQSVENWQESDAGLLPVETTMMVAIPELDGAISPTLFGGRSGSASASSGRDMVPEVERVEALADRVASRIQLRRRARRQRKLAIVLFNFPPNSGAMGTAAYLSVFKSLHNTLKALQREGYDVEVPDSVGALKQSILEGNASQFGTDANVHERVNVDDYVRREPFLADIEAEWGPAPGKHQSDGKAIQVLGRQFGNVLVGIQPAFGYEGDPMRLLFEKGLAPTHAFCAFYRYLKEHFQADAVLHFGTHGALEFMPGKQTGLSGQCWPERLIGDLPNYYLYAANNPSEGTIAKRRSGATLISYLTPALTQAGLYRELSDLQSSVDRWRSGGSETVERSDLAALIQEQATELELAAAASAENDDIDARIAAIAAELQELKSTLIPHGMHVIGEAPGREERSDTLSAMVATELPELDAAAVQAVVSAAMGEASAAAAGEHGDLVKRLAVINDKLSQDSELPAIVKALDGGFVEPVPGGDLLRTPDILPTGRNLHGFDPFHLPSQFAMRAGAKQAQQLIDRYVQDNGALPESVAMVLWGSDNLKSEGGPIAQALHLLGAKPRFDAYGKLVGAELLPLEELDRPRIDVVMTLSGIFRDLLPHQTRLLAEAAWLAASADEPIERNFVRKHVLAYQKDCGCDLETAALRVYSNAVGAYGSNVNQVIDSSHWEDDSELADQYARRKCFAYGRDGVARKQADLLKRTLQDVDFAYQNLESVELGITTIDHYFDTLGGISKAVQQEKGAAVEVYIGDQTGSKDQVRTLSDQVALETRSRILNPRWYEGLLEHGYEGVKQIESHVTNTMGWSATTGKVAPWIYESITETFVLDRDMRERLAALNPAACAKVASRLLEACDREYWTPDEETLAALEEAGEELEDRLEGVAEVAA